MADQSEQEPLMQKNMLVHDRRAVKEDELDILEYWRSVAKRKWSILALAATMALLAAVVAALMTPIYRSTAVLLVEANKPRVLAMEDVNGGITQGREYFQTQVEIVKSRDVAVKVVTQLKLWEHPEYDPRIAHASLLARMLQAIGFSDNPQRREWSESAMVEDVATAMSRHLNVEPIRNTQLININFESSDADLAAKVANKVANVYIESDLEARSKMTRQASNWLQDHSGELKKRLDESEIALQSFRERAGIVDIKSATQSGAGKQIEDLITRTVEARIRRAEAENAYNQIKNAPPGADLSLFPAILRNPIVADAKKQEVEAERKLAEVSQRYGHEHPKYLQAEAELRTARENVRRQVDGVAAGATREYEMARITEKTLENALAAARGSIQNLNRKEFELNVLERDVEANRQMYDMFIKRAKETNVAGDLQTVVARILDPALPGVVIKPQKLRIILIALFSGLLAGVLISLLLDQLDNSLTSTEDAERKLKQPLLTTLPLVNQKDSARTSIARLFLDDPGSDYSEAIRTARTGVLLSSIDLPNRVLLVTSSVPGEGKTSFSINLAMAHAQTKRTLLIDSDLRRPSIAEGLGLPAGANGLSNLVSGTATLDDCLLSIQGSDLKVITSGTIPPNPLELLLSLKFKETLGRLAELFDVIVMDSPPLESVSDALVIGANVTGVIFVVKAMDTPHQVARKSILRMKRADGQILGVVLNQLDFKRAEKYHGEHSAYANYGYRIHAMDSGVARGATRSQGVRARLR